MKVILRNDMENLGRLGDLVDVKPGYGRNYLLPKGHAMLATPANSKIFELERKKLQARAEALRGAASSLAEKIAAVRLSIAMRVGDKDKLYGSVTPALIADTLAEKGLDVDRRRILLDTPIRALGDYSIRVRLHADVIAELALSVIAEKTAHDEEESRSPDGKEIPVPADDAAE